MNNPTGNFSDNQIRVSFDYDKFKRSEKNRPIEPKKVDAFLESWKTKSYLIELNPILVNKNMEIMDGQHRYMACKQGGFPVYYLTSSSLIDEDMITLNKNQNNWGIENYIDFHIKEGNANFIKFSEFRKKSGLSTSLALHFLGLSSKNVTSLIKKGEIKFPSDKEEYLLRTVHLIKSFQEKVFHWFIENKQKNWTTSFRFYQALISCFYEYDIPYILESLETRLGDFCLFSASGDFYKKFEFMGILKKCSDA